MVSYLLLLFHCPLCLFCFSLLLFCIWSPLIYSHDSHAGKFHRQWVFWSVSWIIDNSQQLMSCKSPISAFVFCCEDFAIFGCIKRRWLYLRCNFCMQEDNNILHSLQFASVRFWVSIFISTSASLLYMVRYSKRSLSQLVRVFLQKQRGNSEIQSPSLANPVLFLL